MTKVMLIRHGQPTYRDVEKSGFKGISMDFGQLTQLGIQQAKSVADDPRLQGSELILSSPFTRALQTAAYVAQKVDADIIVETDLHEWLPDLEQQITTRQEVVELYDEYEKNGGEYPLGETRRYETDSMIKERVMRVLDRYRMYSKIIVVCHMVVMQNVVGEKRRFANCEIAEFDL